MWMWVKDDSRLGRYNVVHGSIRYNLLTIIVYTGEVLGDVSDFIITPLDSRV